jgi:hypothetical protein
MLLTLFSCLVISTLSYSHMTILFPLRNSLAYLELVI